MAGWICFAASSIQHSACMAPHLGLHDFCAGVLDALRELPRVILADVHRRLGLHSRRREDTEVKTNSTAQDFVKGHSAMIQLCFGTVAGGTR